jgi:hypothetical protein
MASDDKKADPGLSLVELMRVQPMEANVIAARLRSSGIQASVGPDSPYESVSFSEGIPIFVPADAVQQARAVLDEDNPAD